MAVVVRNPKPGSRTPAAATALGGAIADVLPSSETPTVDLAGIASGLLAPWSLSEGGSIRGDVA